MGSDSNCILSLTLFTEIAQLESDPIYAAHAMRITCTSCFTTPAS